MKCPICDVKMQYDKRKGIDIEQCPDCHGVWMDPLEFDRLMHRRREPTSETTAYRRLDSRQKKSWLREALDGF